MRGVAPGSHRAFHEPFLPTLVEEREKVLSPSTPSGRFVPVAKDRVVATARAGQTAR
jgi:hypothetical protein